MPNGIQQGGVKPTLPPSGWSTRIRFAAMGVAGEVIRGAWQRAERWGGIWPTSRVASTFGTFGEGALVAFPQGALVNPQAIHIGAGTLIGPHTVLAAGIMPDQAGLGRDVVRLGERCVIGRGCGIVGHNRIVIGNDVWTGNHVFITDANHGYEDLGIPIGSQFGAESSVRIGAGSWLGHGVIVLPGSNIGEHVVVGAGSVVTGELPDRCVAVGVPARVVRRFVDGAWRNEPLSTDGGGV